MTIHPHLHYSKQWLLGRNRSEIDVHSDFGLGWTRRIFFDAYWSGEKWFKGTRFAMKFDSEAAAIAYLEANAARMEGANMWRALS